MELLKNVLAVLSPGLLSLAAGLGGGISGEEWSAVAAATVGAVVAWARGNQDSPVKW